MTEYDFWKMVGRCFELYDVPCVECPVYKYEKETGIDLCSSHCEESLKNVYKRILEKGDA